MFHLKKQLRQLISIWNKKTKIDGKNNRINLNKTYPKKLQIKIIGNNNEITARDNVYINRINIFICGDNNKISISEFVKFNDEVTIWIEDNLCNLSIGKESTFEKVDFALTEDNSKIEIGEDCMFAYDIEVKTGDSHSIIDIENKKRINFAKNVHIGNHVWIAAHSILLKGANIPDNCIVASNAVVTKPFDEPNSIIAGNPAKIIKRNITWDRKRLK